MNSPQFFVLSNGFEKNAMHAKSRTKLDPIAVIRGNIVDTPIQYEVCEGRLEKDLIGTTHAGIYLVSDNLIRVLKENTVSGWGVFDIELYFKKGLLSGYSGFFVRGRCGELDNTRCKKKVQPALSEKTQPYTVMTGYYFDEETWDHSDIFIPDNTRVIITTGRVRECLLSSNISNISLTPVEDVERFGLEVT